MFPVESETRPVTQIASSNRSHRVSFKQRTKCIKKKAMELATLCDILLCVIILGPDGEVDTWPENPNEVQGVIDKFKDVAKRSKVKNVERIDPVDKKIIEVEREIEVVKIKNLKNVFRDQYHAWVHGLSKEKLKEVMGDLVSKSEEIDKRIEYLKTGNEHSNDKGREIMLFGTKIGKTGGIGGCSSTFSPQTDEQLVCTTPVYPMNSYESSDGISCANGGASIVGEVLKETKFPFTQENNGKDQFQSLDVCICTKNTCELEFGKYENTHDLSPNKPKNWLKL